MKKELMFAKGDADPTFVIIRNIDIENADIYDYIGSYDLDTMLCCGSRKVQLPSSIIVAHNDNNSTVRDDNFDYGELMGLFYYDFQTDKFFKLYGKITQAYTENEVLPNWFPLGVYYMDNATLGEEIQLAIDPLLTTVSLEAKTQGIIKTNKDKIKLDFVYSNVDSINLVVTAGSGKIIKMWDGYYYQPGNTDSNVIITITGKDIFEDTLLTATFNISLDYTAEGNSLFSNEFLTLYEKLGNLCIKSNLPVIGFQCFRNDKGKEKRIAMYQVLNGTDKVVIQQFTNWKTTKDKYFRSIKIKFWDASNPKSTNIIEKTIAW